MPVEHKTKSGTVYYTSTLEELVPEAAEEARSFAAEVLKWRQSGAAGTVIIERSPEAQASLEKRRAADAAAAAAAAEGK